MEINGYLVNIFCENFKCLLLFIFELQKENKANFCIYLVDCVKMSTIYFFSTLKKKIKNYCWNVEFQNVYLYFRKQLNNLFLGDKPHSSL